MSKSCTQHHDLSPQEENLQSVGNVSLKEAEERLVFLRYRLADRISLAKRKRFELRNPELAYDLTCTDSSTEVCAGITHDYRV